MIYDFEIFKAGFVKAWRETPLLPMKERREMALKTGIGQNGTLQAAWEALKYTRPGLEGLATDAEMLRLGRQMAGFIGRMVRTTEEAKNKKKRKSVAQSAPTNGGNGRKPRVIPTIELLETYFRRACEYGYTPSGDWWGHVMVCGLTHADFNGLVNKLVRDGYIFTVVPHGYTVIQDERRAAIAEIERKMGDLQKQLEDLKNG